MMLIGCSSFSKVFCFVLMEAAWQLLHDKKKVIFSVVLFLDFLANRLPMGIYYNAKFVIDCAREKKNEKVVV